MDADTRDSELATIDRLLAAVRRLDGVSDSAYLHARVRTTIRELNEVARLLLGAGDDKGLATSTTRPAIDDRLVNAVHALVDAVNGMAEGGSPKPSPDRDGRPERDNSRARTAMAMTDAVLRRNAEAMGVSARYQQWLRCGGRRHPVEHLPTIGSAGRRYCPRCWTSFHRETEPEDPQVNAHDRQMPEGLHLESGR